MATQGERKAETRQRLLDAAALLFADRGIDAVSIDAVADAADRTSGAVYAHFGGKDGLLVALLDHLVDDMATVMQAELTLGDEPAVDDERLAALWRTFSDPPPGPGSRSGCCSSTSSGSTPLATRTPGAGWPAASPWPARPPPRPWPNTPSWAKPSCRLPRPGGHPAGGPAHRPGDAEPHRSRRRVRRHRRDRPASPDRLRWPAPTAPPPNLDQHVDQEAEFPMKLDEIDLLAETWSHERPPRRLRRAAGRRPGPLAPRARRPGVLGGDPPRRRGGGEPRHRDLLVGAGLPPSSTPRPTRRWPRCA